MSFLISAPHGVTDCSPEYLAERERMFNLIMQGGKPEIPYLLPNQFGLIGTIREKQRYANDTHISLNPETRLSDYFLSDEK